MIGDDIRIMVVDIGGGKVRLGITAPGKDIHRKEVYDTIHGGGATPSRCLRCGYDGGQHHANCPTLRRASHHG